MDTTRYPTGDEENWRMTSHSNIKRLSFACVILLGFHAGTSFAAAFIQDGAIRTELSETISAEILPRLELLAGALSHTTWMDRRGPQGPGSDYYQALHEHLAPYRHHEAIRLAQVLTDQGFAYDAPPNFILRLSPLPDLEAPYGYSDYLIQRAKGETILEEFRLALQDLSETSAFMDFFASQQLFLEVILQDTLVDFNGVDITDWMEGFFGWTGDRFHLVFAPAMFPSGGYGASVETEHGLDIYQVVRASGYGTVRPGFRTGHALTGLTLHEFSHSFVNPSVAANVDSFMQHDFSSFFNPVEQIMQNQAYGSTGTFINETLVRSVTSLALRDLISPTVFDYSIGGDRLRGFYLNDLVVHELCRYQGQRDLYERFDLFLPSLAATCFDYQDTLLAHTHIPFTLAEALADTRPPAFIVPTAEANAVDANALITYVHDIRDSIDPEAPVFTDVEALQRDMSPYFVRCYGTPTGNRWMQEKLPDLPVIIEPNYVEADTVYAGSHLRFVSAWPDPHLSGGFVLVHTAQQTRDIVGTHAVSTAQPAAYVLYEPGMILRAGFYTEPSSGRRRMPPDFERYPWRSEDVSPCLTQY